MKIIQKWKSYIIPIVAILILFLWLFPYFYMVMSAFKPNAEVFSTPVKVFPSKFSLENFRLLFEGIDVPKFLYNSLVAAIFSTAIAVFLGSLSAYAIARTTGRKLSVFLVLLVLSLKMIPTSSIAVPIFSIITQLKIYDTHLALIIVYAALSMPFVIWLMIGFYSSIPVSLDEAAAIDGASNFRTFISIIIPIVMPGIATASIFTLFLAWNDFLISLLLTSVNAQTFTVAISKFVNSYNTDLGPMMAGAFLFSFPVMIVSYFGQKYIIKGMTSGSVK